MAFLLDTNVAIHLRDGHAEVMAKVDALDGAVMLSIISQVELENGVYRDAALAAVRRSRVDMILSALPVLPFDQTSLEAYRAILQAAGYSRRKLLDRMIAAQALTHRATLVTMNAEDFKDIPGLNVLAWSV